VKNLRRKALFYENFEGKQIVLGEEGDPAS
jgi:hypothetical protein